MIKLVSHCSLLLFLVLPLCSIIAQETDYNKWEVNYTTGKELLKDGKTKEAIPFLEKAYTIAQIIFEKDNQNLYKTAFALGSSYDELKYHKKAISLYLKALNVLKIQGIEIESNYDDILNRLGLSYKEVGDYDSSIKILLERLHLIEKNEGKESLEYSETLNNISIAYKKASDYNNALKYNELSNTIVKKLYGEQSPEYGQNLSSLNQIYIELGKYDKAIQIQTNVLSLFSEKDKTSMGYVVAIYTMAYIYHNVKEYQKEIPLYNEVKEIMAENHGKDHEGYISSNNNLGQAYDLMGDYENALKYTLESVNNTSEDHREYPTRLQNLAFIYTELGELNKALKTYEKALTSCRNISGKKHPLYAKLVDCIGQLHVRKGDLLIAEELFEEALSVFLENFDESHPEYGHYLNNYANTLLGLNQYDEAIDLLITNIKISESNSKTDNEDYYRKQLGLAKAYNKIGNYNDALTILINYRKKLKRKLGANHPDYGEVLKNLAESYVGIGEFQKAIPIIDSANNVLISQIDKVFKFRSEKEKQSFLKITNQYFDETQSIAFQLNKPVGQLNEINLNNQIMLKGLLLNNSKNLLSQLSTLENTDIDNKIISYRSLNNNLTKTLSLPFDERVLDVDSLKEEINNKEVELVKLYNSNFYDENNLSSNWKFSQSELGKDEVAIEFSHFKLSLNSRVTDSTMFAAYLYKVDWESPVMVSLFEESELKDVISKKSPNELYNSKELYNLIWKPIEGYLNNVSTIYFSPSGLLNQIPLAAIKDNISAIANKYDLVQLSSTALLKDKPTEPETSSSLFIGGIVYDYSQQAELETDSNDLAYLNTESLKNSKATRSRGESWTYLPGSLSEIEGLQNIFSSNQKSYSVLIGREATEVNFKKLSGNSPNILHIATHGFFYENIDRKPMYGILALNTEDRYRLADDPLLRSGIILAGANYAWKNGSNPNEEEDGILSAMEISNLDLSNTDMVVLSACETGLGDIDGSEGVYGLQRAFKMAGVDIIVMSLWQVPDAETAEFMNLFYEDWMATKNVRKAFNKAQRNMLKKYKDEPEKWAAFVLFE